MSFFKKKKTSEEVMLDDVNEHETETGGTESTAEVSAVASKPPKKSSKPLVYAAVIALAVTSLYAFVTHNKGTPSQVGSNEGVAMEQASTNGPDLPEPPPVAQDVSGVAGDEASAPAEQPLDSPAASESSAVADQSPEETSVPKETSDAKGKTESVSGGEKEDSLLSAAIEGGAKATDEAMAKDGKPVVAKTSEDGTPYCVYPSKPAKKHRVKKHTGKKRAHKQATGVRGEAVDTDGSRYQRLF